MGLRTPLIICFVANGHKVYLFLDLYRPILLFGHFNPHGISVIFIVLLPILSVIHLCYFKTFGYGTLM